MQIRWDSMSCLRAIEAVVGSRQKLAEFLGVSLSTVNTWHKQRLIPTQYLSPLVQISNGRFTLEELIGDYDDAES